MAAGRETPGLGDRGTRPDLSAAPEASHALDTCPIRLPGDGPATSVRTLEKRLSFPARRFLSGTGEDDAMVS